MYTRNSRVRYSEVDQKGNLTIVSLINYLQDCCAFQSEDLGIGLEYLGRQGRGWYITYWEIKIHSLPRMADEITVSTWPTYFKGMFGGRNFTLKGTNGETLVEADSLWILMDLNEQRPVRMSDEMLAKYEINEQLPGDWQGRKILEYDEYESVGQMEVMPVHLDTNRHMNNAYYIEIARDVLPSEKKVYGIRCEYKKPALLGDVINISSATHEDKVQVKLTSRDDAIYSVIEFEVG